MKCLQCGEEFEGKEGQKYCSAKCWLEAKRLARKEYRRCAHCHKKFEPKTSTQKYCSKACKNKGYYAETREKKLEYQREYYEAKREEMRQYQREWNEAKREEVREYKRKWYAANREKRLEYQKAYDAAHPEQRRARDRAYYASHREELVKKQREKRARQKRLRKCPICGVQFDPKNDGQQYCSHKCRSLGYYRENREEIRVKANARAAAKRAQAKELLDQTGRRFGFPLKHPLRAEHLASEVMAYQMQAMQAELEELEAEQRRQLEEYENESF